MKKNMGSPDHIIRILAVIIFAVLYFTGTVTGELGIVLLVLGGVFLFTNFVGYCPLYAMPGMNTCPRKAPTAI
ncbi:MAG: DUF2892 domain-containing protein [Ferruginibacter sp.]